MRVQDFHLTMRTKQAMLSLLVVLAAAGLRAADEKGSSPTKSPVVVKPASVPVTRMPEQLAPEGFFDSPKRLNVPAPRPPISQRPPADQEEFNRKKSWIDQTAEEAFGLKLDNSILKEKRYQGKGTESGWPNGTGRIPDEGDSKAGGSSPTSSSKDWITSVESSAVANANRPETVPGEMNLEALLRKSSSGERLSFGRGLFPGSRLDNPGIQFDTRQKEQRDTRLNEFRQLFNSNATQPGASAISRSGLENPTRDPFRDPLPRSVPEPPNPAQPQGMSQEPRLRPAQAGVNHLPGIEVVDPRNPGATPSTPAPVGSSIPEKPKQQPTRLTFPKRPL